MLVLSKWLKCYDFRSKTTIPLSTQIVSIVVSDLVAEEGLERLLRLRLAYYSLGDPNSANFGTRLTTLC